MPRPRVSLRGKDLAPRGLPRRPPQGHGPSAAPFARDLGWAVGLGCHFGVDSRNWLNLQSACALWLVERDRVKALAKVQPLARAA